MRHLVAAALLFAAPAAWAGAPASPPAAEAGEKFKLIHVDDLAKMLAAGKVQVFDANHDEFRAENGVIPGAKMLADLHFDPKAVLPADKSAPLVFYCANSH